MAENNHPKWGTLYTRYTSNGKPRKMLSLDGGGIRVMQTLVNKV